MNRRQFIASAALATLVPTWIQRRPTQIDLKAFCWPEDEWWRYEASSPFIQIAGKQPFSFATDGSICVRVATTEQPEGEPECKRPPANQLKWLDRNSAGWKPWPRQHYQLADRSDCTNCGGNCFECPACHKSFPAPDDELICQHLYGNWTSRLVCQTCNGRGMGVFPDLQRVGDVFISSKYDRLVRTKLTQIEYMPNGDDLISVRFDGGEGLLMSLDPQSVEMRLKLP